MLSILAPPLKCKKTGISYCTIRIFLGSLPQFDIALRKVFYNKVSRYTSSSYTDLDIFLNRFQKDLRCTNSCRENLKLHSYLMFLPLSYCTNFELQEFFHSPKNVHLKGLLYMYPVSTQNLHKCGVLDILY